METTLARKNKVAVNRRILNFTAKLVVKCFISTSASKCPHENKHQLVVEKRYH